MTMALQQVQLSTQSHSAGWLTIFPPSVKTLQGSTIFVKQLTALAFSCISYMRSIFPEYAFEPREIDDVKVKVLTGSYDCKDAYLMTRWIKSAFNALDNKYMRELILEVLSVDNNPLEYYAIVYKYDKNGPSCSFSANSKNLDFDSSELEKATKKLITTLLESTEELDHLPQDYRLQLRINYYDEVTPAEYKPKYFDHAEPCDLEKLGYMIRKEIGNVDTPHHTLSIHFGSRLYSLEDSQQMFFKNMAIENSSNIVEETEPSDSSQKAYRNSESQYSKEIYSEKNTPDQMWKKVKYVIGVDDPDLKETQPNTSNPKLNCICNLQITSNHEPSENSSETFRCVHCKSLHHTVCYGKMVGIGEIENGCCYNCAKLIKHAECTDSELSKCKPEKAEHIAAYRQLVIHLHSIKTVNLKTLKDFGVSTVLAGSMLSQLKKGKLIKPMKNSKGVFFVNKSKLKTYIKKYFDI